MDTTETTPVPETIPGNQTSDATDKTTVAAANDDGTKKEDGTVDPDLHTICKNCGYHDVGDVPAERCPACYARYDSNLIHQAPEKKEAIADKEADAEVPSEQAKTAEEEKANGLTEGEALTESQADPEAVEDAPVEEVPAEEAPKEKVPTEAPTEEAEVKETDLKEGAIAS